MGHGMETRFKVETSWFQQESFHSKVQKFIVMNKLFVYILNIIFIVDVDDNNNRFYVLIKINGNVRIYLNCKPVHVTQMGSGGYQLQWRIIYESQKKVFIL